MLILLELFILQNYIFIREFMNTLYDILIIIACIAALWYGALLVVESASKIALKLGISELVIGLTIVAFGTSAPEFAVTISAAIKGQESMSVANIVGSNIFNLGFILGGVAIIHPIITTRKLVWRDGLILIGTSFLLILFLYDLTIEWYEGIILITTLTAYLIFLFYKKEVIEEEEMPEDEFRWTDTLRFLGGLTLILSGGHFFVDSATHIAVALGVSTWVIGVTIVAAGTSAPELATSLTAVIKGKHGISAGNLIGSDLYNLLGVLGIAAIIRPLTVESTAYSSIFLLSGMVILVVIFMRSGWKISRTEGAVLVIINLIRWTLDFMG